MSQPSDDSDATSNESPLSLRRLTTAFAAMLGRKGTAGVSATSESPGLRDVTTNTRTITEALLFVGQPDNAPMSAEELAATMRDVHAAEVADAVAELNAEYEADGSPYRITSSAGGYRLVFREEFERVREKFNGRVREATLSPTVMEVLAVVAYRQPITAGEIDELRKEKSHPLLNQLVRRGLVRLDRSTTTPKQTYYVTTERFLRLFQLANLDQLPKAEEFDMPLPAAPLPAECVG